MGDTDDKDDKQADDLARLPSLFKEWSGVVATFGGAVAAVLAVLFPEKKPPTVQVIGYALALALLVFGAFIFVRVRRRRRSRQQREKRRERWEREAAGSHRTAFRGLFPYQEGDELPGEHRQLEARRLVTQFGEPAFSFGVVCGDSGCGKTSLLRSAIQSRLKAAGEERGFGVLYVGSPRELSDDGAVSSGAHDAGARLGRELDRLRQRAAGAARGRSLTLILDQFEEFFIEYGDPDLRLELGRFLDGLIKSSPPVRILCAIRRDYLADMKDLAPRSPDGADRNFFEPISLRTLFTLKNFTVEQAARVVKECAERDRVEVEDEFAAMLASDLGEGGFVRPPELQIVCTALVGSLTTAEYRLAGGARGILSHYIEDAVGVSGDEAVGRRVLRALCDFPAHAKRNPQTVADIAAAVGAQGAQASASVRTALRQFEVARLVASEKRGKDEPAYALVHDYLVDAVEAATSDVTTRDEEANQLLDYYVSEYRTDAKTRIPYRRLRFIRKHADPKQLSDPTARRLLRASVVKLITFTAALAALVVITTTLLVAVTATQRDVWHQQVVGNHWEGDKSGSVNLAVQAKRGILFSFGDSTKSADNYVKVWDVKTASMIYAFRHERFGWALPDYLLGYAEGEQFATAFNIPARREAPTTLPTQVLWRTSDYPRGQSVSASGKMVSIAPMARFITLPDSQKGRDDRPAPLISVFSLESNGLIGETPGCLRNLTLYQVTDDGDYVFALCGDDGAYRPTVFNVRTQEQRVLIREGYKATNMSDLDSGSGRLATLETSGDGRVTLVLWDIRTGQVINEPRDVNIQADSEGKVRETLNFAEGGEYLYVYSSGFGLKGEDYFELFRTAGLRRVTRTVPQRGVRVVIAATDLEDNDRIRPTVLAWPNESGGTYVWNLIESEPTLIPDLTIPESSPPKMYLSKTAFRAVIYRKDKGQMELWDFKAGKKLRDLDIPVRFKNLDFTIGGNAVSVNVEGGTLSLFRADNGEKITDDISRIGESLPEIYYDEKCNRVHVWTDEGRVLRYTEGWYLFGRESWFWPTEKCVAQ